MNSQDKINLYIEALKVLTDDRDGKEREEIRRHLAKELLMVSYK